MKFFRYLMGIGLCFTFLFALASCSKVSQSYADTINDAFKAGNCITYEEAKETLGSECLDDTKDKNGKLIAVKGVSKDEYKDKKFTEDTTKYEFISITVVQGKCNYAYYGTATYREIVVGIEL